MSRFSLSLDDPFPPELAGGAVSIGNFDGVHLGHAALVAELVAAARATPGPAVTITFDPHPLRLLAPDRFMPQLTSAEDRATALHSVGADHVVILQTSPALLQLDAEAFLQRLLVERLAARAVVEGFNFSFGRNRRGSTELLRSWCGRRDIDCRIVSAYSLDGSEPVSSSRVRSALDRGDIATANALLGRPYRLRGTVAAGARRGATLGFPTANLVDCETVCPADGVYAARVGPHAAAVNIGANPTFAEAHRKIEVHVIDFAGDLYGQPLAVDFLGRLRETRPFPSKELLVAQLNSDVEQARTVALKARVEDALRREVGPALELDGAAIEVLGVENNVARVRLGAVCASCPATLMVLVNGIEDELRKHVPEIEYLEAAP